MTFKESDFPSLLHRIKQAIESTKNPAIAVGLIREIITNYEDIPLYPGIVEMISYNMVKKLPPEELSEGDLVEFDGGKQTITGRVAEMNGDEIILEKAVETKNKEKISVDKSKFESCQKVNQEALQEEWPELYFGEDSQ